MSKLDRFILLLKLAEQAENKAAQLYNEQKQHLINHLNQQKTIEAYYQNFRNQLDNSTGGSIQDLVNKRAYLKQLTDLRDSQQANLNIIEQQTLKAEHHWSKLHHKRLKIEELIESIKQDLTKADDLRTQKLLDELTGIRYHDNQS